MYNRKAIKREAKQLMRASVPHFMLVALVYVLLTTGLDYVVAWLTSDDGLLAGALSIFLNILVWLFSMVMAMGFVHYALRLSRREETGMGSLFHAFSFAGRSLGVQLLTALFLFLWSLLVVFAFTMVAGVLLASLTLSGSAAGAVLMGVLIAALYIASLVLIVAIALRYAMARFALVDDPDAGVMEAIRRSIRMMRGYKGKYFVLELSFLGWDLLVGVIVCAVMGVGFAVSGADQIVEHMLAMVNNLNAMDDLGMVNRAVSMLGELTGRLGLWSLLADLLSLPLTLWLLVYRETAAARFYNYVGGYDYHQYMNGRPSPSDVPLAPPAREPAPPQTGGGDAPRPSAPEEPAGNPQQAEEPERPRTPNGYYTSILPPEFPGGEPETPAEPDGEEEI